jgi:hypothetical protein
MQRAGRVFVEQISSGLQCQNGSKYFLNDSKNGCKTRPFSQTNSHKKNANVNLRLRSMLPAYAIVNIINIENFYSEDEYCLVDKTIKTVSI